MIEKEIDLVTAFTGGLTVERGSITVTTSVFSTGELNIRTGKMIAVDPLSSVSAAPFTQAVPNGNFPVELCVITFPIDGSQQGDERVALARTVFSTKPITQWRLAVRPKEDVKLLRKGQVYGYLVDSGIGCFADAAISKAKPDLGGALRSALKATEKNTWSWANCAAGDVNVVAFSSGYGDGRYGSYFGLDSAGDPVCLVTDFRCLDLALPDNGGDEAAQVAQVQELLVQALAGDHDTYFVPLRELAYYGGAARSAVEPLLRDAAKHRVGDPGNPGAGKLYYVGRVLNAVAKESPEVADEMIAAYERASSVEEKASLLYLLAQLRSKVADHIIGTVVDATKPGVPLPIRVVALQSVGELAIIAGAALPHVLLAANEPALRDHALQALVALLGPEDDDIRSPAADDAAVLGAIGEVGPRAPQRELKIAVMVYGKVSPRSDAAANKLVDLLDAADLEARVAAARYLLRANKQVVAAVSTLIAIVQDASIAAWDRIRPLEALSDAHAADPRIPSLLREIAAGNEKDLADWATDALERIATPQPALT
jgi:hypothetical protein